MAADLCIFNTTNQKQAQLFALMLIQAVRRTSPIANSALQIKRLDLFKPRVDVGPLQKLHALIDHALHFPFAGLHLRQCFVFFPPRPAFLGEKDLSLLLRAGIVNPVAREGQAVLGGEGALPVHGVSVGDFASIFQPEVAIRVDDPLILHKLPALATGETSPYAVSPDVDP